MTMPYKANNDKKRTRNLFSFSAASSKKEFSKTFLLQCLGFGLYFLLYFIVFIAVDCHDNYSTRIGARITLLTFTVFFIPLLVLFYANIARRLNALKFPRWVVYVSLTLAILCTLSFYWFFRNVCYPIVHLPSFLEDYIIAPLLEFEYLFRVYAPINVVLTIVLVCMCYFEKEEK